MPHLRKEIDASFACEKTHANIHATSLLVVATQQFGPLGLRALQFPLPCSLGLRTLGVHLLLDDPLTRLLGLSLVDVFNESTLVLEGVTLGEVVELVVEVLVDLASGTVLDEKTAEDSEAAHPEDLAGHTSILGTLPLTETTVSANSSGGSQGSGTGTGVCGNRLADDEAIANELADGLAGVGVGDFVNLVGVEPDLALSAADNGRREALLRAEIDHFDGLICDGGGGGRNGSKFSRNSHR